MQAAVVRRVSNAALKVVVGVFVVFYVCVSWQVWGWPVLFYVCPLGLLILLAALLFESRFLASLALVGTAPSQVLWSADLFSGLLLGTTPFNVADSILADPQAIMAFRALYHVWAPLVALYLVRRAGYDERARDAALALAVPVILLSASVSAARPESGVANLNLVNGPGLIPSIIWLPILWSLFAILTLCANRLIVRGFDRGPRRDASAPARCSGEPTTS